MTYTATWRWAEYYRDPHLPAKAPLDLSCALMSQHINNILDYLIMNNIYIESAWGLWTCQIHISNPQNESHDSFCALNILLYLHIESKVRLKIVPEPERHTEQQEEQESREKHIVLSVTFVVAISAPLLC